MPQVLAALMAFVAEHRRCGDLDGGTDNGFVWMQCSCGGLIMQPVNESPRLPAAAGPGEMEDRTHDPAAAAVTDQTLPAAAEAVAGAEAVQNAGRHDKEKSL